MSKLAERRKTEGMNHFGIQYIYGNVIMNLFVWLSYKDAFFLKNGRLEGKRCCLRLGTNGRGGYKQRM
jgi:hypothetical protein